jgi:phosphoribosylaminoimidazole-succinocarboxamide synthase
MVISGYLAGHAAREYVLGKRQVCGVTLPEGLKENDILPEPIITPTTKASVGHDEDISREEISKTRYCKRSRLYPIGKLYPPAYLNAVPKLPPNRA